VVSLIGHPTNPWLVIQSEPWAAVKGPDSRTADVLVLAVPIAAMPETLAGLVGLAGIVTDLASTKAHVMRWAAAAGVDLVGGHPTRA